MSQKEVETLISLRPKTTYEKLLWEKRLTKLLKDDIFILEGKNKDLEATIKGLIDEMKKSQVGALIIKCRKLKKQLEIKEEKNRKLKRDNEELILNLTRLQTTGSINNEVSEDTGQDN